MKALNRLLMLKQFSVLRQANGRVIGVDIRDAIELEIHVARVCRDEEKANVL